MKKWMISLIVAIAIFSGCNKTPEKILLNNQPIEYNKNLIQMIDIRSRKHKVDGPCKCPENYDYVVKFASGKRTTIFGIDILSKEKDIRITANVENDHYYEHTIKDDEEYSELIGVLEKYNGSVE